MEQFVRRPIDLPVSLLQDAEALARREDITLGQVIRRALATELRRALREQAKSPERADERYLAVCRARFADDFAYARSWGDLRERLQMKGAVLREAGGGLALVTLPGGARICKASDIGASLQTLARRFRAPFPGHRSGYPHVHTGTTNRDETEVLD